MSVKIITVQNEEFNKKEVPKEGYKYHFFDDGKTSASRHYIVKIKKVIPFNELTSKELIKEIKYEQKDCDWLYNSVTDYVIEGNLLDIDIGPVYFIRDVDGGWFSIGFWAGRLDIDGSWYKRIINDHYKFFKDMEGWTSLEDAKNNYNKDSHVTKEGLKGVIE